MNRNMPQHVGEVGILNVAAGDTKLSFDPKNPVERIRAARIVKDMIRRGYALLVEKTPGSGEYTRALDFIEDVAEYVVADLDPVAAAEADAKEEEDHGHQQSEAATGTATTAAAPAQRGVTKRRVKASSTRAVAVAPSAGG